MPTRGLARPVRAAAVGLALTFAVAACSGTDAAPAPTTFPAPRYASPTPLDGAVIRVDDSAATVTVPGLLVALFGDDQDPSDALPGIAAAVRPDGADGPASVVAYGRARGAAIVRLTARRLHRVRVVVACTAPTEVTVAVYYSADAEGRNRQTQTAGCRGGDDLSALDFRLDPRRRPVAFLAQSRTGGVYTLAALAWRG